jgi:hypothetical protein
MVILAENESMHSCQAAKLSVAAGLPAPRTGRFLVTKSGKLRAANMQIGI